jgi:hypothetical protein
MKKLAVCPCGATVFLYRDGDAWRYESHADYIQD